MWRLGTRTQHHHWQFCFGLLPEMSELGTSTGIHSWFPDPALSPGCVKHYFHWAKDITAQSKISKIQWLAKLISRRNIYWGYSENISFTLKSFYREGTLCHNRILTASLNLGAFCNIAIYLAVKLEGSGKSHDGEQERKDLHFKINPFSVTKITVPATIWNWACGGDSLDMLLESWRGLNLLGIPDATEGRLIYAK